jgi:K(+)-stimulated pyrophosphate-energized sodium pump
MGDGHGSEQKNMTAGQKEASCKVDACSSSCSSTMKDMKCDMSKCASMSREECAKMCDSLKCSPKEKEMCMKHYDKDGKWIGMNNHHGTNQNCCSKN